MTPQVQPLSHKHRNFFFYFLAGAFFISLPFLFLYASGYRFSLIQNAWVSTGGLYVAADRTGAEIYIDDELVRETRAFRRAFYAQGLKAETHKVHVQKNGHHTWVKELPVYPHLVTEALAFNLPVSPSVRVIAPWQTATGVSVLTASSSVLSNATGINQYLFEPRAATTTLVVNPEFESLFDVFFPATTALPSNAVSDFSTTTKELGGVRLFQKDDEILATYVGPQSQMPYYYCAEEFPPYNRATTTPKVQAAVAAADVVHAAMNPETELLLDVKTVSPDTECDPVIAINQAGEETRQFDFFPGSSDFVLLEQETGIYVVEVDDRAWQNRQPLLLGKDLSFIVEGDNIYVYDGRVIYQIVISQNWF